MIDWLPFAKQTLESNSLVLIYHSSCNFIPTIDRIFALSESGALRTYKYNTWIGFYLNLSRLSINAE